VAVATTGPPELFVQPRTDGSRARQDGDVTVTGPPQPPTVDDFAATLDLVVDRLRTLGESRLLRHDAATGLSLSEQVHRLVVGWAALIHGADAPVPPRLAPLASGDQLAVVGREVIEAWRSERLDAAAQLRVMEGLDSVRRAA
jgi:hypothetical protein